MRVHQRQPHRLGTRKARTGPPSSALLGGLPDQTLPVAPPPAIEFEPTILGFPAEFAPGAEPDVADREPAVGSRSRTPAPAPPPPGAGASAAHPVVLRRSEWAGGVALVLAGIGAAVSLALPWWRGADATGVTLLEQGLGVLRSGVGPLGRSGLWQPVVVVLGGGVLLVLGLLLFRPARTHRVVGLLALLVTLAVTAGVVVPIADANWSTAAFGSGMWVAVGIAVLGLAGAVKAMETAPRLGGPPA
jgi:hypothetical protein